MRFILFFICGLFLFSSPRIEARPLNLVIMEMEPFGFLTEDRQITGILHGMLKRIAEETGLAYELNLLPFARAIRYIETGQADAVIMFPNEQTEQVAIRVAPISLARNIVLGAAGTRYTSLEDLHGKVVANVRGANYDDAFTSETKISKYAVNDYEQGLKMLVNNRLDGIAGTEGGILYIAKKLGYSRNQFGEPLILNTRQTYLYFSKHTADEAIIQQLKAIIDRLREQDTFEKIQSSYIGEF